MKNGWCQNITLLAGEEVEAVIASIRSYLETVRKNEMITRQFLLSLRTDVTQMVYVWLSEMGIYANALFSDKESENSMLGAVNGFNEMMEYVENLMRKAVGYKLYITKEDSVADQICTYIDSHFREEIHRDELAAVFQSIRFHYILDIVIFPILQKCLRRIQD